MIRLEKDLLHKSRYCSYELTAIIAGYWPFGKHGIKMRQILRKPFSTLSVTAQLEQKSDTELLEPVRPPNLEWLST